MKVSRRNFLKSIVLGVPGLAIPNQVFAWGAFHEFAATHQMIDRKAYSLLRNDPAMMINPFPPIEAILSWDYAITPTTGTGPDVDGRSKVTGEKLAKKWAKAFPVANLWPKLEARTEKILGN